MKDKYAQLLTEAIDYAHVATVRFNVREDLWSSNNIVHTYVCRSHVGDSTRNF